VLQEKMKYIASALLAAVTGLVLLHVYSLEGLGGLVLSRFFEEDTVYSPGFKDSEFRSVKEGMTEDQVRTLLPAPLGEVWFYRNQDTVELSNDKADLAAPLLGIKAGMKKGDVLKILGEPAIKTLVYSRSANDKSYHVRAVKLTRGKVSARLSEFYLD
jgi:outer membrane protein assembly factor BamE (lipoprotein component of BamABCDE complex)